MRETIRVGLETQAGIFSRTEFRRGRAGSGPVGLGLDQIRGGGVCLGHLGLEHRSDWRSDQVGQGLGHPGWVWATWGVAEAPSGQGLGHLGWGPLGQGALRGRT